MSKQETETTEKTDAAPPKKSSKMKFIVIGLGIILVLGIAGGGAAFFYFGKSDALKTASAAPPEEKSGPAVFLPLEVFTVNLQSETGDKFLQTNISLQLPSDDQISYYKENMPQLRSRVLLLLSSKSVADLLTNEGKTKLVEEIKKDIQRPYTNKQMTPKEIESSRVSGVFFTSFLIQ